MELYPDDANLGDARRVQTDTVSKKLQWYRALVVVLVLMLGFFVWIEGRAWLAGSRDPHATPRPIVPRQPLSSGELGTINLFEKTSPSVVYIANVGVRQDFFTLNVYEIPQGTGSGFIWDENGYVVTNAHVIQGARRLQVKLADQSMWPAQFVGWEPDKDLAVLKIDAPRDQLRPIAVGRSGDLRVGQNVLAIGNPFGFDQTLTTGIISGLGREIQSVTNRPIRDVIQTDAAINPGNSGGPLLDSAGRLIGVNTAIFSPSGAYAGIGFAVPVDTVNRLVPQLIRYGKVRRAAMGIELASDSVAKSYDLSGVLVRRVQRGSAAARAGVRPSRVGRNGEVVLGDVIVEVGDIPVRNVEDLLRILDEREVDETVTVSVTRGNQSVDLEVTLQELRE